MQTCIHSLNMKIRHFIFVKHSHTHYTFIDSRANKVVNTHIHHQTNKISKNKCKTNYINTSGFICFCFSKKYCGKFIFVVLRMYYENDGKQCNIHYIII